MSAEADAEAWIAALGLRPHPEGGFYRETYRATLEVEAPYGTRSASTAIYFLLLPGTFSALHRVRADEVWHHYAGDPVDLHVIDEAGAGTASHAVVRLGPSVIAGQQPQHVVRAGSWQATVAASTRFALCGCTVAPGFDFADFEMPSRAELSARLPALRGWIEKLTR